MDKYSKPYVDYGYYFAMINRQYCLLYNGKIVVACPSYDAYLAGCRLLHGQESK